MNEVDNDVVIVVDVGVVYLVVFGVLLSVGRFPTSYVRPSLAVMRCLVDSNRPEEWSIPLHSGTTQKACALVTSVKLKPCLATL